VMLWCHNSLFCSFCGLLWEVSATFYTHKYSRFRHIFSKFMTLQTLKPELLHKHRFSESRYSLSDLSRIVACGKNVCFLDLMLYLLWQHAANAATCCNTLQYAATHCNTLHHTASRCITLHHTATHATHCNNAVQHTAVLCNTLQYTAARFSCKTHVLYPATNLCYTTYSTEWQTQLVAPHHTGHFPQTSHKLLVVFAGNDPYHAR